MAGLESQPYSIPEAIAPFHLDLGGDVPKRPSKYRCVLVFSGNAYRARFGKVADLSSREFEPRLTRTSPLVSSWSNCATAEKKNEPDSKPHQAPNGPELTGADPHAEKYIPRAE